MDENFSFGYWLKRQRLARDLRQPELAAQLGIATVTLRKIEADERRPSLQLVMRIAEVFALDEAECITLQRVARAELNSAALALPSRANLTSAVSPAAAPPTADLPSGTVTFLFTDIEGSSRLWERDADAMHLALARHMALLERAIATHRGAVVKGMGDGLFAAFAAPGDALDAALMGQRALLAEPWSLSEPLRVRMAVHSGQAEPVDGDYLGPVVNRAARLLAAGHGGQLLLSLASAELLRESLPEGVELRELGAYRLKNLSRPEPIFQVVAAGLPATFPPLNALATQPHNLPRQPTPFVGRAAELIDIDARIADEDMRLSTIVGPGGMGKTRLALAAAERQLGTTHVPDGVFFVALAPLDAAEQLVPKLAEALSFPLAAHAVQARAPLQQLLDFLQPKRLLLILDNCEHLLDGVRELATALLAEAPGVRLLATSRERLDLRGEQLFTIGGLSAGEHADAVTLFAATAARRQPGFTLGEENHAHVARICGLVGGMPLAIELAAGWVDLLTLQAIAEEIVDGLDVLATDAYDMPARHRSLRAVFGATWQRLSAPERAVFARLAVFRGGCTRQALQTIAGASLRQMHMLIAASLVQHQPERERYALHELLRQYAAERLADDAGEEQAAHERHAAYYLGMLAEHAADLKGARQREALDAIGLDRENIWAAWGWAVGQRHVDLLKGALEPLGLFYKWRGRYEEGLAAFVAASSGLAGIEAPAALLMRALALGWQNQFTCLLGHMEEATLMAGAALALLDAPALADTDTRAARAFLLLRHADTGSLRNTALAFAHIQESLALARACQDSWAIASAALMLAFMQSLYGHKDEALVLFSECLQILRELGDRMIRAETLVGMSWTARYLGRYREAYAYAEECLALGQQLDNPALRAQGYSNLGMSAWCIGEFERAHAALSETLAICTELGDPDGTGMLCHTHYRLSQALVALGRAAEARATAERGLQLARQSGDTLNQCTCLCQLGQFALIAGDDIQARERLIASLHAATEVGAVEEGNASSGNLALAEYRLGDVDAAREQMVASLRDAVRLASWLVLLRIVACAATLLAWEGRAELALGLGALVLDQPCISGSLYGKLLWAALADAATAVTPDVVAAAQERGRQADLQAAVQELLMELEATG
jgi:predicted ATPase/class 3 adenylate cyclase/tetratricopeptide (TPR) repeat protein